MGVKIVPQSTFVRRYLIVMSVLIIAATLALLALRAGVNAKMAQQPAQAAVTTLPIVGEAGEFALTDQTGAAFSSSSLRGKIYVVDFMFTSCTNVCPVMSGAMAQLHREFAGNDRVAFVSVSVDPATDTPAVLERYAKRFDADTTRWHFLTGDDAAIQSIAKDRFKLGHADKPVNHATNFVLVDGAGKIRGYYIGTEADSVAALREHMKLLLDELGGATQAK